MTDPKEILERLREFNKSAFQPMPPPMYPSMAGGAPPMDPSMAGGAPPPGGGDPMEEIVMALQEVMTVVEQMDARIQQLEGALMGPQGMEQGGMPPDMEQGGMPPGMEQGAPPMM